MSSTLLSEYWIFWFWVERNVNLEYTIETSAISLPSDVYTINANTLVH